MNACGRQAFAPLPVINPNVMMDITAKVCEVHHHQHHTHVAAPPSAAAPIVVDDSDAEQMECNTADMDPTMANDPRIIVNLLALERATMPHCDYFRHVQRDIQPFMRKVVTTWMLEVSVDGHMRIGLCGGICKMNTTNLNFW